MSNEYLDDIRQKVRAGERLSFEDGVFLYEHADVFTLGERVIRPAKEKQRFAGKRLHGHAIGRLVGQRNQREFQ